MKPSVPIVSCSNLSGFWPKGGGRELGTISGNLGHIAAGLGAPVFLEDGEPALLLFDSYLGGWTVAGNLFPRSAAYPALGDERDRIMNETDTFSIFVQRHLPFADAKLAVRQRLAGLGELALYD